MAREAIQNSCDASQREHGYREAGPVKVLVHKRSLLGRDKRKFVSTLELKAGPITRLKYLGLPKNTSFRFANDPKIPLHILTIEDWNTIGLGGSAKGFGNDAHFWRLLFTLGDEVKALGDDTSGGSYGFGKGVYSGTADTYTFIAYSSFRPTQATERHSARLLGCGLYDKHQLERTKIFTGRAWYAKSGSARGVQPFLDDEAHKIVDSLGLTTRGQDQADWGTTLVILGFDAHMDELRKGIEDFWWPRIIDHELQVTLLQDGKALDPPRPKRREDLKPFLHCYDLAKGISQPTSASERRNDLQTLFGKKTGSWGATAVEASSAEGSDEAEDGNPLLNTVALIRQPKMVVQYHRPFRAVTTPFAAVFHADPDVNTILKLSEPFSHNDWDHNSDRLKKIENGAEIVKGIRSRIYAQLRRFLMSLTPPPPPRDGRIRSLERELGQLFRRFQPTPNPPDPPTQRQEAVHIQTHGPIFQGDGGQTSVSWSISFLLNQTMGVEQQAIRASFRLLLLADDNHTVDEEIPISIHAQSNEVQVDGHTASFCVSTDAAKTIKVTSGAYDPAWLRSWSSPRNR